MNFQTLGLILLGVGTICAIWSALCPSAFTIAKFGFREGTEEDKEVLKESMVIAVLIIAAVIIGMWLVFKK